MPIGHEDDKPELRGRNRGAFVLLYICFVDKYSEKTSSHAAAGRLTRRTINELTCRG